jgi:hypothetical protein
MLKQLTTLACLLAAPASAQTVIDGSDNQVPKDRLDEIKARISDLAPDPVSAQIQRLQVHKVQSLADESVKRMPPHDPVEQQSGNSSPELRKLWEDAIKQLNEAGQRGETYICGELNVKSRSGFYSGFHLFVLDPLASKGTTLWISGPDLKPGNYLVSEDRLKLLCSL